METDDNDHRYKVTISKLVVEWCTPLGLGDGLGRHKIYKEETIVLV